MPTTKKPNGRSAYHAYQCKTHVLAGRKYTEVMPQARKIFRSLQQKTKRRPYVRSTYFRKDKVFFDQFWTHMNAKSIPDRTRRLRYLPCTLELLRETRNNPLTFIDSNQPETMKHQFLGKSPDCKKFVVVISEHRSSGRKQLLSMYPRK